MDMNHFMPHGQCYLWQKDLLLLHVLSDAIIVLSYYSIPIALLYIVRKRSDLKYSWIYALFGVFIFLCGTTHLLSIWTVWVPDYWLSGFIKLFTAIVSLLTAALIWPLIPKILRIPSHDQLMNINKKLEEEIERHKKTEHQLRKLSLAVQHSPNMVVIANAKSVIEYCNPAFCEVSGYQLEEVLGRKTNLLKSGLTGLGTYRKLWSAIRSGKVWHGEFLNRKKDGELFWCLESIAPVKNAEGVTTHFVSVIHDINDRKKSEETIKHLAYFDPLTNLPNRTLFKERLEQAIYHGRRSPIQFAVMYLDLDRFKNINDTLGHVVGDKLLQEAGRRITACLREQETVARLGGDEFAIIGLDLRAPSDAGEIAMRVVNSIAEPFLIEGHEFSISTSLGISIYPDDATDIEQLISHADDALYAAKRSGKNKFEFFNQESNALALRRLTLENHLRHSLERNELSLVYQPKIDLKTSEIVGAEVLLRWNPSLGQVGPDEFIPIAEDTGLIVEIGSWVIRTACLGYMQQLHRPDRDLPLAINLSARQFKQDNLLEIIDTIILETGIPANRLEFEITESMLMTNPEQAIKQMHGFKERGITLAIDDFGTGYSSLAYLRRFPVDKLKIDKSFVRDVSMNHDDACIVESIIALAHSMGLKVVAEGVETGMQVEFLQERNCDEVQGYYFYRPMPLDELRQLLP
jgi:diguanylate cyclase (GGDEF)-like protein/PAS domain S-box-containing protein